MATLKVPTRQIIVSAVAAVIGLAPVAAVFVVSSVDPAPTAVAQDGCSGSDLTDSYSLQCVPSMVPDFSDQLTEAEVAEPGFNANPGGGGGGHR
jgi:hypothetical protein